MSVMHKVDYVRVDCFFVRYLMMEAERNDKLTPALRREMAACKPRDSKKVQKFIEQLWPLPPDEEVERISIELQPIKTKWAYYARFPYVHPKDWQRRQNRLIARSPCEKYGKFGGDDMAVICPICMANIPAEQSACAQCGTDLKGYLSVYWAPDILYNEAEQLLLEGEARTAYDKLAAAHFLRPHDVGIVTAMAECAEQAGDVQGALEKIALAMVDAPDNPTFQYEFARLNALLEEQAKAQVGVTGPVDLTPEALAAVKQQALAALRETIGGMIVAGAPPTRGM